MSQTNPGLFVRRNGIDNPQILFLHGFPENSRKWEPYLEAFGIQNIGAVAFDLPGYGQSPLIDGDYNVLDVADQVISQWNLESSEPVYLVGHDWGGIVGWYIASKLAHKIRGFTAVATPYPSRFAELLASDSEQQKASRYIDIFCSETGEDYCKKHRFEALTSGLRSAENHVKEDEISELVDNWSEPGRLAAMLQYYRTFFSDSTRWSKALGPITTDVQLLWGGQDRALTVRNIASLDSRLPQLKIDLLDDAGHWLDRSHLDTVFSKIRSHFEQTAKR